MPATYHAPIPCQYQIMRTDPNASGERSEPVTIRDDRGRMLGFARQVEGSTKKTENVFRFCRRSAPSNRPVSFGVTLYYRPDPAAPKNENVFVFSSLSVQRFVGPVTLARAKKTATLRFFFGARPWRESGEKNIRRNFPMLGRMSENPAGWIWPYPLL